MNLGGPDSLEAVEPFLFNLFSDRAIIRLPGILRWPLARLIARRRAKVAREIYERLGGASPLLANTEAQARALETELGEDCRCFVAMRYWHPMSSRYRGRSQGLGAGRNRLPSALSAILDDHNGVITCVVASGRAVAWSRSPYLSDLLLPGGIWIYRNHCPVAAARFGRGLSAPATDAPVAERSWIAKKDRASRRSVSGAGSADRGGDRFRFRHPRA